MASSEIETSIWHGCYESGWKGVITPESFAHPAKFSRSLIERIFSHCLKRGYIRKGDSVGDCFGGIGTGGIMAAYQGIEWIGCELEPRFVAMAEVNFKLHQAAWTTMRLPWPRIIQGDSRGFDVLLGEDYDAMVSSPPFVQSGVIDHEGQTSALVGKFKGGGVKFLENYDYGKTPGQIGQLKSGSVDGVISSPPFRDARSNTTKSTPTKHGGFCESTHYTTQAGAGYGEAKGQIDNLPTGHIDAVCTSPPYAEGCGHGGGPNGRGDGKPIDTNLSGMLAGYGETDGQIGGTKPETYFEAMDAVYRACFLAIKPSGVICLVLKDYVSKRQRVPLCDDTARLLEHCGFTVIERIQAMLVKETRHSDMFAGETVEKTERKSFFRRLAEKKGSPPIDFEEVIIARKPL